MKYLYKGPISGVSLRVGEHQQEVILHPNTEVELPEDNTYTKTLLALQHLIPLTPSNSKSSHVMSQSDFEFLSSAMVKGVHDYVS